MQKMAKAKKAGIAILVVFLVLAILGMTAGMILGIWIKADRYTDEQHLQRVTELVQKHFMTEDSLYTNNKYTDMRIYPLYNAEDKLEYFLIEFEPYGYMYVQINQESGNAIMRSFGVYGMYTRDDDSVPWKRYRICDDENPLPENWKPHGSYKHINGWCEVDENGEFIEYYDSHFKVANIGDERRYLIEFNLPNHYGYIPAVKRGDKFLNLVSMEEFDLEDLNNNKIIPTGGIYFLAKGSMDL